MSSIIRANALRTIAAATTAGATFILAHSHHEGELSQQNHRASSSFHRASSINKTTSNQSNTVLSFLSTLIQSQRSIAFCNTSNSASTNEQQTVLECEQIEERYHTTATNDANEVLEDLLCQMESLECKVIEIRAKYKDCVRAEYRKQQNRSKTRYDMISTSISKCQSLSNKERKVLLLDVEKAREESKADLETEYKRELMRRHEDFVLLEKDVSRAHKQYLLRVRAAEHGMRAALGAYRHRLAKLAPEHYTDDGGAGGASHGNQTISEAEDTIITFMSTEAGQ